MILIFALTVLVVLVPVIHVINERYIQRIALIIGSTQLALMAFTGSLNDQLKEVLVSGVNQVSLFVSSAVIEKISYLLFTF